MWGTITTLSDGRPNRIVDVTVTGVLVETGKSADEGDGPKLVSAWMVEVAWEHLELTARCSSATSSEPTAST